MTGTMTISIDKIAWCPFCNDQLDTWKCFNTKGLISGYLYACDGCNKWFELKEVALSGQE
jgi:hypothetical protein